MDRKLYQEAVLRHVCSKCIDFGEDDICHSPDPAGCAIFRYLPELVAIAERLRTLQIQPYVDAVREDICMKCRRGSLSKDCSLQTSLDCALDRYLPLVLEAIDEVKKGQEWYLWRQL